MLIDQPLPMARLLYMWKLLKKRSAALWLALLVAGVVAWALYPQSNTQSSFRDEVMAIANAEWKEGRGHINITKVLKKQLRQNPRRSEIELFKDIGLKEVVVSRPQPDLLEEYNADTYRGFEAVVRRVGVVSYWEVWAVAFYRNGVFVDVLAYASYASL